MPNKFYEQLQDQSEGDWVKVVRCKDCKRNGTELCPMLFTTMKDNDFCSYGERRERMTDFIDKQATMNAVGLTIDAINFNPTKYVDAQGNELVAVVRCKDCKHYWKNEPSDGVPVCLASPKDDAFCSEGERKEDVRSNDR